MPLEADLFEIVVYSQDSENNYYGHTWILSYERVLLYLVNIRRNVQSGESVVIRPIYGDKLEERHRKHLDYDPANLSDLWAQPANPRYCECIECTAQRNPKPKTHYIAMSGLYGCLPSYCVACEDYDSAYESLRDLYIGDYPSDCETLLQQVRFTDLMNDAMNDLKRNAFCNLPHGIGNDYCEIVECGCGDPDSHNDD